MLRLGLTWTVDARVVTITATALNLGDLLVLRCHLVDKLFLLGKRQLTSIKFLGKINMLANGFLFASGTIGTVLPLFLPVLPIGATLKECFLYVLFLFFFFEFTVYNVENRFV